MQTTYQITSLDRFSLAVLSLLVLCFNLRTATSAESAASNPFVHPGLLHNRAELEFIKAKIKLGDEPWKTAYVKFAADRHSQLSYRARPEANVVRDLGGNWKGAYEMGDDALAAYANALRWTLTGDVKHAEKAVEIINSWSNKVQTIEGHDAKLLAGIVGYKFCNAAEILRHTYDGWKKPDQDRCERMLLEVIYPVIKDFFPEANGNWDASMIVTCMSIGVFCERRDIYERAVEYYLHGQGHGAILNYVLSSGQCQESTRDQTHTQLGLAFLADVCETAWKQGLDLYSAYDNRLALGFEYTAKYNLGQDVPCAGKISPKQRGEFRPTYEKLHHHYHDRVGLEMKYTRQVLDKIRPEGSHWDHVSWGTLFFRDLPAEISGRRAERDTWQFSVTAQATNTRVDLYIPPTCERIRGAIVSLDNLVEKPLLEDSQIRAAAAAENLAIIWFARTPKARPFDKGFHAKQGDDELLSQVLADLAKVSGYDELTHVPLLTLGHSAAAPFAWEFAEAHPERTLGVIHFKSSLSRSPKPTEHSPIEGVPVLIVKGQFEEWSQPNPPTDREASWQGVRKTALAFRMQNDRNLIGYLCAASDGHFESSPELTRILAMFIRKAAQRRIPAQEPTSELNDIAILRPISPEEGWLTDSAMAFEPETANIASPADFQGDRAAAFWYFDRELAEAVRNFGGDQKGKAPQMVTMSIAGKVLPLSTRGIVETRFQPLEDGRTFELSGDFFPKVPSGVLHDGDTLGHAAGPVVVQFVKGPAEQIGPATFRLRFDRTCFTDRNSDLWFIASEPGNAKIRRADQACLISLPGKNSQGTPHTITFPEIGEQPLSRERVELKATTDSGLPVEYYVESGPAIIASNKLHFTTLPPRTRFPVKVTVVALQWGRTIEPLYQSAEPVPQTVWIHQP